MNDEQVEMVGRCEEKIFFFFKCYRRADCLKKIINQIAFILAHGSWPAIKNPLIQFALLQGNVHDTIINDACTTQTQTLPLALIKGLNFAGFVVWL